MVLKFFRLRWRGAVKEAVQLERRKQDTDVHFNVYVHRCES
jgi:hypothetical protein